MHVSMVKSHVTTPTPPTPWFILGTSVTLGLLFDYFFYDKTPGLAFPVFVLLSLGGMYFIAHTLRVRIGSGSRWLSALAVAFSSIVAIRASGLLVFLNVATTLYLMLLIATTTFGPQLRSFRLRQYVHTWLLPFDFIRPMAHTLSKVLYAGRKSNSRKMGVRVLKGCLLAAPIFLVFLALLSSADMVFSQYVSDVFAFQMPEEAVFRTVLIGAVSMFFVGSYAYIFGQRSSVLTTLATSRTLRLGNVEAAIVLGSVTFLFTTFIIVQIAYLFGGLDTITNQGFTYAEYARRGFFELIAVAVLSFALMLALDKSLTPKPDRHATWFRLLTCVLVSEVAIMMVSAFRRLMLYEEAYGFTVLRLFSHAFIVLLAALFGLLLLKICTGLKEHRFAFSMFVCVLVFVGVMNIINPDAFVASRNLNRFNSTKKLDTAYLASLSEDASKQVTTLLDSPDEVARNGMAHSLYMRTQWYPQPHYTGWQSWNASRKHGQNVLQARQSQLESQKDFMQSPESGAYIQ